MKDRTFLGLPLIHTTNISALIMNYLFYIVFFLFGAFLFQENYEYNGSEWGFVMLISYCLGFIVQHVFRFICYVFGLADFFYDYKWDILFQPLFILALILIQS